MAATSLFFYDLETSGFNPREARIMQFAGQRTDMDLAPVGEAHNYYIRLSDDILPDPDAALVTGITPQKTISDGMSEADFLKLFFKEIATPNTIFVGYNTVRFDDEFMRYLMYRNFYDAYEWQWQDGRSRWDLLDVVRMTRALRPSDIAWPFDAKEKPTNRLEQIAALNKLEHANAHDALSDVSATISVARLIRKKQPKLFDFLLTMRDKKEVTQLVMSDQPFVYTSGKYPSEFEKTTLAGLVAEHPKGQGALVFDLRHDPEPFLKLEPAELAEAMRWRKDNDGVRLPVKTLKFNRCPAVAPIGVLDAASQEKLNLDIEVCQANYKKLRRVRQHFGQQIVAALEILDKKLQTRLVQDELDVDARLYEAFFTNQDKVHMRVVRSAAPEELGSLSLTFADDRLTALLPLYKARNFPKTLNEEERKAWESYRERKLMLGDAESRAAKFFQRLSELDGQASRTDAERYILEELQLYGQSIMPMRD